MAAKFVDESICIHRFSDFNTEPRRMLPPILGYENMPLVSLEEAVNPLISLVPEVERMVWTVKQNHFEGEHGLTDDESASILLYTIEWEPRDKSFYTILNKTLQAANRSLLKPWFLYIRLIMTSLAKLPSDSCRLIVYRGVKLDLSAQYSTGSTVTWWGFSSCTTSLDVLSDERFLGHNGTRTLFNIECHSAKSIKQFSFYPEEEEVLLPPARQFQVMGCLNQGNGLHIIQLKEIQPKFPLMNPIQQPSTISSEPKRQSMPTPPVKEAPKTFAPPVKEAPKTFAPPVKEAPKTFAPPVKEAPKTFAPPVKEAPKTLAPPVKETPKTFVPPVKEAPKTLAPPVKETPKTFVPPVKEAPKTLAPPVKETPKTFVPPECDDLKLQKHMDALNLDPTSSILNLVNNQIRPQRAQYLSNTLQENQTCTTQNIFVNQIGDLHSRNGEQRNFDEYSNKQYQPSLPTRTTVNNKDDQILSVSGKLRCSACKDELRQGSAMVVESHRLYYHLECFRCYVCNLPVSTAFEGTDVHLRNNRLHCRNCFLDNSSE